MLDARLAGPWLALFGGLVAAAVVVLTQGAGWVAVVFLLLGALPLLLDGVISRPQTGQTYSPSNAMGYWQDWLSGWYWQTDADHRMVLLKPDQGDAQSWLLAQQLTQSGLPVWQCLASGATVPAAQAALAMLEMRLKAGLPLDVAGLPCPTGPAHPQGADHGDDVLRSTSHLIGVPRLDAHGQFAGHHGVWRMAAASVQAEPANTGAGAAAAPTPMSEAEQEVLRYALSHDLRAPLRVVDGFTRIVKEDYGRLLDRIGNDHLERVLAATARMNGMIDAILEQAQLAQAPVVRAWVDLSGLAQEVAAEQRAAQRSGLPGQAGAANASTAVEIVVEPGMSAQADPVLVRRVLDNLIGNALKYSGKVASPRVEVGRVPATNPCVFYVRDNGAGFDMQHADKLFGLFQRLHSHKDFPGTGVGLAGVQNIVRRHGGRVWAEAEPGKGACFYFTLMGSAAATSLRTTAAPSAPPAGAAQGSAPQQLPLMADLAGTPRSVPATGAPRPRRSVQGPQA